MKIQVYKIPVLFDKDGQMIVEEDKKELLREEETSGDILRLSTQIGTYNASQVRETSAIIGKYILRKILAG